MFSLNIILFINLLILLIFDDISIHASPSEANEKLTKRDLFNVNQPSSKMIKLQRRSSNLVLFDESKCKGMPKQKTGPSGNPIYLSTGCQYVAMGYNTNHKRDLIRGEKRGFIVLPPHLTDQGKIRFDIQKGDENELVLLQKRSPSPSPKPSLLATAITSFATSYGQNKANKRTRTITIQAPPTPNNMMMPIYQSRNRLISFGNRQIQPVHAGHAGHVGGGMMMMM